MFAIAAVPGLAVDFPGRHAQLAVIIGMIIAAFAGAARGASIDVWTLYAASIVTGFGIAIMQPGVPTLTREWLPARDYARHGLLYRRHADRLDVCSIADHPADAAAGRRLVGRLELWGLGHRPGAADHSGFFSAV